MLCVNTHSPFTHSIKVSLVAGPRFTDPTYKGEKKEKLHRKFLSKDNQKDWSTERQDKIKQRQELVGLPVSSSFLFIRVGTCYQTHSVSCPGYAELL